MILKNRKREKEGRERERKRERERERERDRKREERKTETHKYTDKATENTYIYTPYSTYVYSPLVAPTANRKIMAMGKLTLKANNKVENPVARELVTITGRRPFMSATEPHT